MNAAEMEVLLKERGHSLTPQRRAILNFLAGNPHHPTAAQIHEAVTRQLPVSSRATVYNTIGLLKELGALQEVVLPGGEARLDPNHSPHHHFRCTCCEGLTDLPEHQVTLQLKPESGLVPQRAQVLFEGLCQGCLE